MAGNTIFIVEDEKITAKDMEMSLKKLGYSVVGMADTGEKAITQVDETRPDLVLMDIKLKGDMDGIQAAETIRETIDVPVVFLTANADEATLSRAKNAQPYGYLSKPFKEQDVHSTIEMAIYKHGKETEVRKERDLLYNIAEGKEDKDYIFVKSNSRLVKLRFGDIYFVEALKDYVVINTLEKRYTIHSTMKDIESKLRADLFMRVHRSFIINVDRIAAIEQPNVILENDKKVVPIGGSYKDALNQRINLM